MLNCFFITAQLFKFLNSLQYMSIHILIIICLMERIDKKVHCWGSNKGGWASTDELLFTATVIYLYHNLIGTIFTIVWISHMPSLRCNPDRKTKTNGRQGRGISVTNHCRCINRVSWIILLPGRSRISVGEILESIKATGRTSNCMTWAIILIQGVGA